MSFAMTLSCILKANAESWVPTIMTAIENAGKCCTFFFSSWLMVNSWLVSIYCL